MSTRAIEPHTVLASRYAVEDLLAEDGNAESWRAFDQILMRSVLLQVLPSSSPDGARLIEAAKHASRVADPRILKVLDAVDDGMVAYVVHEWVSGQTLETALTEGPLPPRRAALLLREVADALAVAHQAGVVHGCLTPSKVVLTDTGGVKVLGLSTSAALLSPGPLPQDPQDDAQALGRLLYACLTARWPAESGSGLPQAPKVRGKYLLPRQVRVGVPRSLDGLCDRILMLSSPYRSEQPLTAAGQIKDALTHLLATSSAGIGARVPGNGKSDPWAPTAPGSGTGEASPRSSAGGAAHVTPTTPVHRKRHSGRPATAGLWAVLAFVVAATMAAAYVFGQQGTSTPQKRLARSPAAPISTSALHRLPIKAAESFDPPPGSGSENPGLVPLAIDGNPDTAWVTLTYRGSPRLGNIKQGVGLVLDLGRVRTVRRAVVMLQGKPTSLQLRAAPRTATSAPRTSADQYRLLGALRTAGTAATFRLDSPISTRFLLVWLTSLPPVGPDHYRGAVAEVKVFR